MGNLYRLNPFYEWEISSYPNKPTLPAEINLKGKSLEYLFIPFSSQYDFVLLSHTPDENFINYIKKHFPDSGNIVTEIPDKSLNLIEWGKFHSKIQNGKLIPDEKLIQESKKINSKLFQYEISKNYLNKGIERRIFSKEAITKQIPKLPFIIKRDISFSGTFANIIQSKEDLIHFFNNTYNEKEIYFIEEWKETRNRDFSYLFSIDTEIKFLSKTKMITNAKGIYCGSILEDNDSNLETYLNFLNIIHSEHLKNYSGPISIDGFHYTENNIKKTQPISEINFRHSLGRVLYNIADENNSKKHGAFFIKNFWKKSEFSKAVEELEEEGKKRNIKVIVLTPSHIEGKGVSSIFLYLQSENEENILNYWKFYDEFKKYHKNNNL
ncbi:MAG: hypothetical protein KDK36_13765 [Leptospiraceae bacterium]|nr:hypothetical protein [Leptospiraceae bacterium]